MNVTLNSVLLPDDLVWRDEFEWAPVEQVVTPTLSGALLVEETAKPEGRPLTLSGQLIVFETLFALLYAFIWRQSGPNLLEGAAIVLVVGGVCWSMRQHEPVTAGATS